MAVRLEIKRSIAPNDLWHWMVVFDSGHIFATSEESYESAEICAVAASLCGLDALHAAERTEKRMAGDATAIAVNKVAPMAHPTFDHDGDGDPTDETLAAIKEWQPDSSEDGRDPWVAGDATAVAANKVAPMANPTFDHDGDPTDETLAAIEEWQPDFSEGGRDPWAEFIRFCQEAWNTDYGTVREETDEEGKTLLCFVTGGWSANEAVQGAMMGNMMFRVMRWHSSYRGGLVKYAAR